MRNAALTTFAALILGGLASPLSATDEGLELFEKRIRPLLAKHCYKCHSERSGKMKSGLALDSFVGWRNGGERGAVIVPGNPDESLLLRAVGHEDSELRMPPKYKLREADLAALKRWVKLGAPDPRSQPTPPPQTKIDLEAGRQFWAFQPIRAPTAPEVRDPRWPLDELDRFILARLEAEGLRPVADADRETLIRRVTFDLIGLPPTPEEIDAFVADESPRAFEEVVDRLLASRHFGERWGRHWLDVARYAESMGRTRNFPFPYAWRYRDYVLASFNADKPYDRFITEQIAGDLLPHESPEAHREALTATGFLALGSHDLNERDSVKYKMDVVDEQIDTMSRSILALTLACARCHDHKFDPVPTEDYYALAGIFRSTDTLNGYANRRGGNKNYAQANLLVSFADGDEDPSDAAEVAAHQKTLDGVETKLQKAKRRLKRSAADQRKKDQKNQKAGNDRRRGQTDATAKLRQEIRKLEAERKQLIKNAPPPGDLAMGARDSSTPADCRVNIKGEPRDLGASVPRGFVRVVGVSDVETIPRDGSGRLELARWMTSSKNSLTTRVLVNRVWAHLFGRGIVRTVDNFGKTGERPTHPELLDHLATRFRKGGWSIKKIIRSIVLSRTYRMGSDHDANNYEIDSDDLLLWRMRTRRVEVEALRDAMLSVSRQLEAEPPTASPVLNIRANEIGRRGRAPTMTSKHRSVYLPILRGNVPGMFQTFDFAEPSGVKGARDVTTVAPQALFLMNNPFVIEQAGRAADLLLERQGLDAAGRVARAYRETFARRPTGDEAERALAYVTEFVESESAARNARRDAWASLYQALFASAEFRYLR